MSKQTAANVNFISHTSEKSCTYGITTFWFPLCDFPLMRFFTSPKMGISRGPPVPAQGPRLTNDKKMRTTKSCVLKKGGVNPFHKSQKSERT